ncbi:MAG: DegQ family serine endoprotease [Planctomycetota bacterium]
MTRNKRTSSTVLLVLVVGLGAFTIARSWPYLMAKASYAMQRGIAEASQEQLAVANDLSQAFQHVAKALRPSVVSISSVRRVQLQQRGGRGRGSELPEEFRRFFGDDFFEEFPFEAPSPPRGFQQEGMGTGVIVSDEGYILTNNHVVAGADEVNVRLSDNREFRAEIVGTDKPTDIAVLKVDADGLVAAKLGDSKSMDVGEWVLAMGSPFGLSQTVTAGIISATGRANMGIADYEDFIQTDAAINPGNSGGPLVNLQGEVVGIATAIASRNGGYQGIGFAIPSHMARGVLDSIVKEGHVTRGYLGAMIQDLDEDLARSFSYDSTDGVLIGDIIEGGPAEKAGLKSGDIVATLNGKEVTTANDFRNSMAGIAPGTTVKLEVVRNGEKKQFEVTVGELDAAELALKRGQGTESAVNLGMAVRTLTPDLAQQLGYEGDQEGVVVMEVQPGSLAQRVGIRPKDVIVGANGTPIRSAAEFREATRDSDLEDGVRLQLMREGARRYVFLKSAE